MPGDFLIFQLESGFALLRVLDVQESNGDSIWHIAVYGDLFLDAETAEVAIDRPETLVVEIPHAALTSRAFESTQVAKMKNVALTSADLSAYDAWKNSSEQPVFDRSVRLLLGLR